MTNSEIVDLLELTGRLMELHDRDQFKTRSFQTAAFNLAKSTADLANPP
ncbi:helix-hairpin-helix domain-containing protein, partial [Spirosoma sp.]